VGGSQDERRRASVGHVDFFTVGQSIDDTDISLKGPKLSQKARGALSPTQEDYYERNVVHASDIATLKVAYESKRAKPRRRWQFWKNRNQTAAQPAADSSDETEGHPH
jgi:hypothetical protein